MSWVESSFKTSYLASMIALVASAFSGLGTNVTVSNQITAISFGLITGICAIISAQIMILQEVKG